MPEVKLISPITRREIKKTRVAAYCRVSSTSADQLNSYARQIQVYTKMINLHPEWEMVEVFADEGISGMKTDNRAEFQRMIKMCEHHEIDLILTKSVSRFARNVKEALQYARKLKLLGVAIQFEKEGINTLSMGDEMLLNTFSAIAQEESQSISQNQRLAANKRMQSGEYVSSNAAYGYRLIDKGLKAYEPEAEVVRWIFMSYINGWSTFEIARDLTERGVPTRNGKQKWSANRVSYILMNERYIGDMLLQKNYGETTIPFKQHKNRGQADMYYIKNTHDGIIDPDVYEAVQELLSKRRQRFAKNQKQNIYPLTSRIRCSECGSFYHRTIRNGTAKWVCEKHKQNASSCSSNYYYEDSIYDAFLSVVNRLRYAEPDILGNVVLRLEAASLEYKRNNSEAAQISQSIAELNAKRLMLERLRGKGYLAPEVYEAQVREINSLLSKQKTARSNAFESKIQEMQHEVKRLKNILWAFDEPLEVFNEKLFADIIKEIEVDKRGGITFTLIGNLRFTENIQE